jgi:hypothetical protein
MFDHHPDMLKAQLLRLSKFMCQQRVVVVVVEGVINEGERGINIPTRPPKRL